MKKIFSILIFSTILFSTLFAQNPILVCPNNKIGTSESDGINNYDCSTLVTSAMEVSPTFKDSLGVYNLSYVITGATNKVGSGSIAGSTFNVGVSTVTYNLKQSTNLVATCNFDITIIDNEAPKFNILTPNVYDACLYQNVSEPNLTFYDNCNFGVNLTLVSKNTESLISTCKTRTKTIKYVEKETYTYNLTDASGNSAVINTYIFKRDSVSPIALIKNMLSKQIQNTNYQISSAEFDNGSYDFCGSIVSFSACIGANCTNFSNNLTISKSLIPTGQQNITLPIKVRVMDVCNNATVVNSNLYLFR